MKKALSVLLMVCLVLTTTSCGLFNKGGNNKGNESQTAEESSNRHVQRPESSSKEDTSSEPESSTDSSEEQESQPDSSSPESSESKPESSETKPESSESKQESKEDSSEDQGMIGDESSEEESSSEPEESSSKPDEFSEASEEESSQNDEKPDYASYTFPDWYNASDEETNYIIAQTVEAYLYLNDMGTCLEHMSSPVSYDWKTMPWYVEENGEIYFTQPTADGKGENYIPSGINSTGWEYHFSEYLGWSGICCGPWKEENVLEANYFVMSFTATDVFFMAYGRMYSEFFGSVDGSYKYDENAKQVTISIIDGTDLVYDVCVLYKHIILIQRSEFGLLSGEEPGTVYVLTMQEPQG